MPDPFRDETIAGWVGDFGETPAFHGLPAPAKEWAETVLPAFLRRACEERDVGPGDLEEGDMRPGLLEGVGSLELPKSARDAAPEACARLLEELEKQGRLGGGRVLAGYVRALKGALDPKPFRNPGAKIGRNDPCPCGSGRKYKQCCMGRGI